MSKKVKFLGKENININFTVNFHQKPEFLCKRILPEEEITIRKTNQMPILIEQNTIPILQKTPNKKKKNC